MERAAQFVHTPAFLAQSAATMQADIGQRLDASIALTHDDPLVVGDVVRDVIARIGDVVLAADELPHPAPDLVDFLVVELTRVEPLDIEVLSTEVVIDVVAQHCRHRTRIVVEVLLHADTGRAGAGRLERLTLGRRQLSHANSLGGVLRLCPKRYWSASKDTRLAESSPRQK